MEGGWVICKIEEIKREMQIEIIARVIEACESVECTCVVAERKGNVWWKGMP